MFCLSKLLEYNNIMIQCHDNPDADAIASAYAVYTYLKKHNKTADIIYSGHEQISKANLLEMIIRLNIPIKYIKEPLDLITLVLVDCQYGEKNVRCFPANKVAVIDHHIEKEKNYDIGVVCARVGSCSTVVWDLLRKAQFDFKSHPDVSTALYYGLYTDTNNLAEITHPLDKDMLDSLKVDTDIIKKLKYSNLTLSELTIAGKALTQVNINHELRYAVFMAEPCDPNILGFISDLALQVNDIDVCVVCSPLRDGFKLSVRSCVRAVMANEFIEFLTENVGSGGGHVQKAGGFINKYALEEFSPNIEAYLEKRIHEYYSGYTVINAACHNLDIAVMRRFKKKKITVGYVLSTDIFKEGTPLLIRTLEGDTETEASDEIYVMIGIFGEAYPIKAERFKKTYAPVKYTFQGVFPYSPTVKNKLTGESIEIINFANACVPLDDAFVYAAPLPGNTKVLTEWNKEGYMYGQSGDFLAVKHDNYHDVYIVRKDIFEQTYIGI